MAPLTIDTISGPNGEAVVIVSSDDDDDAPLVPAKRRSVVPFSREDYAVKRAKSGAKAALRRDCVTMMRTLRTNPLFLSHHDRLDYQRENYPCPKYYKTITDLTAHRNFLEMVTEFYKDYDRNKETNFAMNWQTRNRVLVLKC